MLGLGGIVLIPAAAAAAATPVARGDLVISLPNEVDEYTPTGTFVQHLITSADGLGYATGSAFDGNGNLYVTDFYNNQILERSASTGIVSVFADNSSLGGGHVFNSPESVVFDKGYHHMYVSDANRDGPGGGVNVIDMTTHADSAFYPLPSSYGSEGGGESDWLAFDANSNLYMTNENTSQGVMKVDTSTGDIVQPSFVSSFPNYGYALSFDKDGNLWVGDTNSILEYDSRGGLLKTITNASFSTIFAAVFNAAGDRFYAGDLDTGYVYAYDLSGHLVDSFSAGSSVGGLSVAGAAIPPNSGGPIAVQVAGATSAEPSLAVDPHNPNHVVVGYNHISYNTVTAQLDYRCDWSETTDGGTTWTEGSLPGLAHSNYGSDPTVRFASDGTLYYSCEVIGSWSAGLHQHSRNVDILLYQSDNGRASQFNADAAVITSAHQSCNASFFNKNSCNRKQGVPLDHPSLVMAHRPGSASRTATRAVLCWTKIAGNAPFHTFTAWRDPDGTTGGKQYLGDGYYCFMSGPPTMTSVSWLDWSGSFVAVKTSFDGGDYWTQVLTFATPGLLKRNNVDAEIMAAPVALTVSDGAGGLHVVVGDRANGQARVYVADSKAGYAETAVLSKDNAFLPGVGNCQSIVAAYERSASGYGYTVWVRDTSGHYSSVFQTSQDMGAGYTTDAGYQRIGDYTDAGCVGTTAWVAWTDSHAGKVTIRAVRLDVPRQDS